MDLPQRKRNRLEHYDYSSNGAYFVTICTEERRQTLCRITGDGLPDLKRQGVVAEAYIRKIAEKYPCVRVDKYVVMPNHIHMILRIERDFGTGNPSPTLGNVIGWYKYNVTKHINTEAGSPTKRVFQRSYHDHIIRNEQDYRMIWEYIEGNPSKWAEDCFYVGDGSPVPPDPGNR